MAAVAAVRKLPWSKEWFDTRLAVPVSEMTVDGANWLLFRHDRGVFHFPPDVYDDLLLRASGLDFGPEKPDPRELLCTVCRKRFTALRSDALYCSAACRKQGSRRRDVTVTGRMVPQ